MGAARASAVHISRLRQVIPGDARLSRTVVSIGKKYAVHLPKSVLEELQLKESEKSLLTVEGERIVLRRIPDFFTSAKKSPKRLRLTPEEVERSSVEAQKELLGVGD